MIAMDFGALPPEVNSARMYAGPGSASMMAAAAAWSGLAAELSSATTGYQEVISELTGQEWQGPSATAMATAAAPYVQWIGTVAAQAEQAAGQARAAAAAYEAAFAATVPPPVIATNRATMATLVATNTLGQNSPAIAANQAEYATMWAQDAAAMYGYAAGSAAATKLTPFTPPPPTTNPAGQAGQATANTGATAGSSTASALQALASPAATTQGVVPPPIQSLIDGWLQFTGTPLLSSANQLAGSFGVTMVNVGAGPFNSSAFQMFTLGGMLNAGAANGTIWGEQAVAAAAPAAALSSQTSPGGPGATLAGSSGPVSAGLGQAASVRGLAVPQSWGVSSASSGAMSASAPFVTTALSSTDPAGLPATTAMRAGGWSGDRPLIAGVVNAPRKDASRSRFKSRVGKTPAAVGKPGAYQQTSGRWRQPDRRIAETPSVLSDHERNELEALRNAVGKLTKERDAAARLIRKEFRA